MVIIRPHRLAWFRTPGFHPGNTGSNPVGVTKSNLVVAFDATPSFIVTKQRLTLYLMKVKFFYIYILFSLKDNQLYIGYTENLRARLGEHFHGKVRATYHRRPLVLINYEALTNKKDAKAREKFLKSGFGRSQLKKALQNRLKELGYKHAL